MSKGHKRTHLEKFGYENTYKATRDNPNDDLEHVSVLKQNVTASEQMLPNHQPK